MVNTIACGARTLDLSRPRIMGVLNVTPDSFSDGGQLYRDGHVDTDALLLSWRLNAPGFRSAWKLSKLRLMGWEHTGSELRGHFLGHWLSATAMVVAVTGDAELRARMDSVVASLAEVAEGMQQPG